MIMAVALPIMLMLLFVYVFGGAIDTGTAYINYVVPGIILLCAAFGASTTAVGASSDMTEGIIDRFRTLPIAQSSFLTGHVLASVVRNLLIGRPARRQLALAPTNRRPSGSPARRFCAALRRRRRPPRAGRDRHDSKERPPVSR